MNNKWFCKTKFCTAFCLDELRSSTPLQNPVLYPVWQGKAPPSAKTKSCASKSTFFLRSIAFFRSVACKQTNKQTNKLAITLLLTLLNRFVDKRSLSKTSRWEADLNCHGKSCNLKHYPIMLSHHIVACLFFCKLRS